MASHVTICSITLGCGESLISLSCSLSLSQLGHGDTLKRTRPVQIAAMADKGIVSLACGQYHSLALDDDHRWVCQCIS